MGENGKKLVLLFHQVTTTRVLHFAQDNGGETLCKFAILALDNRMCYNV